MKVLLPASNLPCNVLVTLLRCLGIITAVTSFVPSPSLTTKDDQQSVLQVSCNGCGPCTRRIPTRGTGRTPWQYFSGASSDMTSELAVARPLELWLDARVGTVGWQQFAASADAIVLGPAAKDGCGTSASTSKRQVAVTEEGKLIDGAGRLLGASLAVDNPKSQNRALSLVGSVDWIQVTCSDWTMIPAENLVSAAGGTPTRIALEVTESSQVQGAAFALQIGVDALLLRPEPDLWAAAVSAREQRNAAFAAAPNGTPSSRTASALDGVGKPQKGTGVTLCAARVTGIREGGVGDRVCVDLIQSLGAGEGMLVGSSAKLLALVHAETFETGFVPARPFRVNAGPVHSYALLADGSTKYLSELMAGDQILVVDYKGHSRAVAIGRLKVETRPMVMVEFESEARNRGQIFLQQAETVRLISPVSSVDALEADEGSVVPWESLPVTDIDGGEMILVREVRRGTHVGQPIDAIVTES